MSSSAKYIPVDIPSDDEDDDVLEEHDQNNNSNEVHPSTSQALTQEQIERIENNRKRALEIRKTKEETANKMYYKEKQSC